jgi:uncharacterized protein (TIGR02246 family)
MNRHQLLLAAALGVVAVFALGGQRDRSPAQDRDSAPAAASAQQPSKADSPEAAIRQLGASYTKAFNAGDAKAVAAFWTVDGEFTTPEGETVRGRDAIEKGLAEQFKAQPKMSIEVTVDSLRTIGRNTAVAEGVIRSRVPNDPEPVQTRYSALFVREEDGWKVASVREWVPDPATDVSLKDVDWLLGEWTAKGDGGELRIVYTYDENKMFIHGKYSLSKDGKVVHSGTQIIGNDPLGGLRSWVFDGSGTTGDSAWLRDGNKWVIEAVGTLPDGADVTAVNVLVPLGPDSFTWQSTNRVVGGVEMPDQPPLKVTRVK